MFGTKLAAVEVHPGVQVDSVSGVGGRRRGTFPQLPREGCGRDLRSRDQGPTTDGSRPGVLPPLTPGVETVLWVSVLDHRQRLY